MEQYKLPWLPPIHPSNLYKVNGLGMTGGGNQHPRALLRNRENVETRQAGYAAR